ncbi:MAG: hypothetical protein Q8896_00835 [Bacteroidota bacterium]|nr:hypothetical protein [Bacteroidota bacterium]MDP4234963.1 hypothetical protein [Bacteroidota bacterium]
MRDTLTNGEQRYLVHFGFNLIFVNRPDGPWEQVDGRTNTWEMLRKYHAIKGDTFAWKGGIRVASIDTLITVPTGSYRSYHYTDATPSPYKRSDDYMAPGVGFLKMEFRQRADTKAGSPFSYGKIDLTSFRLH